MEYANHATVEQEPEKTLKALVKDSKRGNVLTLDKRLIQYIPNTHKSPLGITDINHPIKTPRPFFDATFCAKYWSNAINDMRSTDKQIGVIFPTTFIETLQWIWNLRITYPGEEIFIGYNNITGAFRTIPYHPALVAMHSFIIHGILFLYTCLTFGDCTSPVTF